MLNNYCTKHHKEKIKYCQIHKKYLCIDCPCESISCFAQIIEIKNDNNNNKYNTTNNNDNKNRKKENNNNIKNNNNLNLDSFSRAENKFNIIENKINSFFIHVLELKDISDNYINYNKKSLKSINNLIKQEKRKKKKNFNFMKDFKLNDIDQIINKIDSFINENNSILSENFAKKLNQLNIIEKINIDNDNNINKNNSNNNINHINNINDNIIKKENENIIKKENENIIKKDNENKIKKDNENIKNENENIIKKDNENIKNENLVIFKTKKENEIYNSEKFLLESNYSSNDIYYEKDENNNNKKIISEMKIINSKEEKEKITTIILFKKKYIAYAKNNSDNINFELLTDDLSSFSKEIIAFSTAQKNINYIKELDNSILLSASNNKTVKIFSIDLNKKNPGQLLKEINIIKSLIKVIETSKFLYILFNNNKKSKDPILNIYDYDINNNNKNLKESKNIFENSTPNDIIYFKRDKFGLEEDIEEIVISFAKEEKIIFYNVKKNFNKKIINDIKCSKKKDTMIIYNDLLIIGGQNIFYFIDLYRKKIIYKKNETIIVYTLSILDYIIFAGTPNGKIRVFKITDEYKLDLITQKKLENNNIVNCLLCNEDKKLIYVYYYPIINILSFNFKD